MEWLTNIGMMQHYDVFMEHGFGDAIVASQTINDDDLVRILIKKLAHRKLILLQIANNGVLQNKVVRIQTEDIDMGEIADLPFDGIEDEDDDDEIDTIYRRRGQSNMNPNGNQ